MKTMRSGLSNVLALVAIVGLAELLIAFFSNAYSGPATPGSSQIAPPAGAQTSPLPTPTVSVPPVKIGSPVLMQPTGQLGLTYANQDQLLSIVKKDNKEYLASFDPTTGRERKLMDKNPWWPRLSNHWLVYTDLSAPGAANYYSRIKVLDTNTGKEVDLGKGDAVQTLPSISGDTVVWIDSRNVSQAGPDIYAYDLVTNKEIPVVGGPGIRSYPKISGKWVVYLQWTDELPDARAVGTAELRAHSLQTGEDFAIGLTPRTQDSFLGTYHAIDGDKVAWTKYNASTYAGELHLYDLKTRTDRTLTEPRNFGPAILSISSHTGLIVYNDAGPWIILDYLQPTPTPVPLTQPAKSLGGYELTTSGNYLIWQVSMVPHDNVMQAFVMKVTRFKVSRYRIHALQFEPTYRAPSARASRSLSE